jgi:hypothetical protein
MFVRGARHELLRDHRAILCAMVLPAVAAGSCAIGCYCARHFHVETLQYLDQFNRRYRPHIRLGADKQGHAFTIFIGRDAAH